MGRKTTLVDVLEAAYAVERDEEAWLGELGEVVGGLLDVGLGAHSFRVDLTGGGPLVADPRLFGGTDAWRASWRQNWWEPVVEALDHTQLGFAVAFGSVFHATHLWEAGVRHVTTYRELLARLGASGWASAFARYTGRPQDGRLFYPDSLNVVALDASRRGLAFIGNRAEVAKGPVAPPVRATWERVAGHVSASLRLRQRLGVGAAPVEAVIEPNGKVAHAEGDARDRVALAALREAAKRVDRARTRAVRGTPDALELWQGLQARRWTLVDQFERDGRRYYVARPNQPEGAPSDALASLTERERQAVALLAMGRSNKAIAYELGIAPSSVSTLLARAVAKTGCGSVPRLAALAREVVLARSTG